MDQDPDVIHRDENCTVYRPGSGRGVLVSTLVDSNADVAARGLLSAREAKRQGFMGRTRPQLTDVLFFRPSSECSQTTTRDCYQIRVDPFKTYVFNQEYHARRWTTEGEPRMLLSDYIDLAKRLPPDYYVGDSGDDEGEGEDEPFKPFNIYNKNGLYEIRVKMDVMPYNYFETKNGKPLRSSGGGTDYVTFKGHRYKVRTGPRGGKFVIVGKNKEKHYVSV